VSDIDVRHRALLQTLIDHDVRFVLVGGVALQLHGYSGATQDVDVTIAVDPTNRMHVTAALEGLGAREYLVGARGTAYTTRHGRLEVMNSTDGIGDYDAWKRDAVDIKMADGLIVAVGAPSDLLASKEAAGRPKDLEVLPLIRAELLAAGTLGIGDVRGEVAELEHEPPPDPATETFLGDRPTDRRSRALWDRGANLLAEYRRRWKLDDDDAIRRPTGDTPQAQDHAALKRQLNRLQRLIDRGSKDV
jgi:hypothetical protein